MPDAKTFVLQIWNNQPGLHSPSGKRGNGFWAVVKYGDVLFQFETQESLTRFLSEIPFPERRALLSSEEEHSDELRSA